MVMSQTAEEYTIEWNDSPRSFDLEGEKVEIPTFQGSQHSYESQLVPVSANKIELPTGYTANDVSVQILERVDNTSLNRAFQEIFDASGETLSWEIKEERGTPVLLVWYVPFDEQSSQAVSRYRVNYKVKRAAGSRKTSNFASSSVLAEGDWYKIGVTEDGVYRISSEDLDNLGIDTESLDPQSLNIFGNSFGQLPYDNSVERPDDLLLNAIYVHGEADASFDEEDYILFYAKGPDTWSYNFEDSRFEHFKHEYSDTSYYFIGINTGFLPKRISNLPSSGSSPTVQVTSFDDYAFHHVNRENVLKSGRTWFGEKFDIQNVYTFGGDRFTFPNIVEESPVTFRSRLMSRNTVTSSTFTCSVNNEEASVSIPRVGTGVVSDFGQTRDVEISLNTPDPSLNITFSYNNSNIPSASGWLDWFEVNVRRELRMARAQMAFRDIESTGIGQVARYNVSNANSIEEIWDVTDPSNVRRVQYALSGGNASFTLPSGVLNEFIAFTGSTFLQPGLFGRVENQNLHALGMEGGVDMVIVAPSLLVNEAEQLAEIHRNHPEDPLSVEVVKLGQIYNEFSSGMRDVTAIKWLMKMLYDRSIDNPDEMPRYLLLFGDGSYDNVNFSTNNSNLIPTYQSENSLNPTNSFVSDDYYGLLGDEEGEANSDVLDISVGRLTVKNRAEAATVVNKIRRYVETSIEGDLTANSQSQAFGSWRNVIALVADDEDGELYMEQSRDISAQIESYTKVYNIERIFIDAFQQVATPGGDRYPDVNEAIKRRVQNGAFIMNYIGHGGETGWAQERILNVPTILDWTNTNRMPIFMTATCEFTRYDDPLRTSAGEYVLLNAAGGGIALLTTTRLVYAGPNYRLNQSFYDALFVLAAEDDVLRLGDVYRDCKTNAPGNSTSYRNFSLIGDPALPMAVPKYNAAVTSITDTLGVPVDTLKALGVARVSGFVGVGSNPLTSFNGIVEATVFDRVKLRNTLANDGGDVLTYPTQEDVIYRGFAEVTNGQFEFDFVLPKDISFAVDTTARISLYAYSNESDAAGFIDQLTIGSRDENAQNDGQGPDVDLFMNDENFVFGGYTDNEPILLAKVFDPNGINTVGTGIGHDISAVLDGDVANTLILNDYYTSDLSTFQSGQVRYPFDELEPGSHSVELTVWDVHNNSSKSLIEFIVAENEELAIERVLNYPNPFTTNTEFFFEHNQSAEFLNVLIEVFTVTGKLVKTINTVSNTDGFRNEPIPWNGLDDYGDRLATGTYVYKVSVKNQAGDTDMKFEKLVILN
jgi:hypothetical protein